MIPIHARSEKSYGKVTVNRLSGLMEYDASATHRHDYFELFVFGKGGGIHTIDFEPFPIHDRSVHIVAPGRTHQVRRELDSNGFVLLFDPDVLHADLLISDFLFDHTCYDVHEHSPIYTFSELTGAGIQETALSLWDDYTSESPMKNDLVVHQLALLCIRCLQQRPAFAKAQATFHGNTYREFRRLLYRNFRQMKKVKEYAAVLNISEKQLNEIVKLHTGNVASVAIYKQITTEAKRLLNAGLSAKEAAFELEFDDPAHFSKFFKNQTGMSATDFRKVHA